MYEPINVEQVTPGAAENAMFGTSVPAALTRMIPLNVIIVFADVDVGFRTPPVTELKIAVALPLTVVFRADGIVVNVVQVQFVIVAVVRTKLIDVLCDVIPVVKRY